MLLAQGHAIYVLWVVHNKILSGFILEIWSRKADKGGQVYNWVYSKKGSEVYKVHRVCIACFYLGVWGNAPRKILKSSYYKIEYESNFSQNCCKNQLFILLLIFVCCYYTIQKFWGRKFWQNSSYQNWWIIFWNCQSTQNNNFVLTFYRSL